MVQERKYERCSVSYKQGKTHVCDHVEPSVHWGLKPQWK